MKRAKKMLAMMLSLAMVMAMSLTAFAVPVTETTGFLVVKNVSANSTVKAYQIVTYDQKGEYSLVEGISTNLVPGMEIEKNSEDGKMWQPNAEDILKIAQSIATSQNSVVKYAGTAGFTIQPNGDYKSDGKVAAGMWIVLVDSGSDTIYNPMLVSVQVDQDGNVVDGEVDANGDYFFNAYAKSSEPTITKKVLNPSYELNDKINFEVTADIPAYSEAYETVIYKIYDELSSELKYAEDVDVVVTINGIEYETTPVFNGQKMTITIDSDTALEYAGGKVVVTYSAELTAEAKVNLKNNVNPTTNKVTLEYSNNPSDENDTTKKDDNTHHYTFGIDGSVLGGGSKEHYNFVKTETGEYETTLVNKVEMAKTPLAGAEFELVDANHNKIAGINNFTTGADGRTTFMGLSANTTYYLHEVKAPAGYTLRDDYIPVLIEAEFDEEDGALKDGWTIKIGEKVTATYSWDQGNTDTVVVIDGEKESPFLFQNTKLTELPSTGGIGTTIFTIGGCIIMIAAAALFFASRRKKAEN